MGVPSSEAGYTSATTGRGDHEVHKGYVVALLGGKKSYSFVIPTTSATCYHLVHLDIFSPIVIPELKIQVFWDVTPYRLVTSVKQLALRNVGKYLVVDIAKHRRGPEPLAEHLWQLASGIL
jgi:hypothetical protein